MTKGDYGHEIGFDLYDDTGQFTISDVVKIFVKKQGASTNSINGVTCNTAGPFTIRGRAWDAKYSFTNSEMDLTAGTYLLRFTHGTGSNIITFPTDPSQWYGKIIINPAPI